MSNVSLESLISDLDHQDQDRGWLALLRTFLPVGVADSRQIQAATGLGRDRVNRIINRFERAAPRNAPILTRVTQSLSRATVSRRPPTVYALAETGAALLRHLEHLQVKPCGLSQPTPIAHALCTLDLRLAALAAGLNVQTETKITRGQQTLRPDNLVALDNGQQVMFEIEQIAQPDYLRRIINGLRNKCAFFGGKTVDISPTVRVLFNLRPSRDWDKTLRIWEQAIAAVATERNGRLPFRLLALPLPEFLAQPDWQEPSDDDRWQELGNRIDEGRVNKEEVGKEETDEATSAVATTQTSAPSTGSGRRGSGSKPQKASLSKLPAGLSRVARPGDDRLILRAYWQLFLEQAQDTLPAADPAFFDLVSLIYAASHGDGRSPLARAALPSASLYLLNRYLALHPGLRGKLDSSITYDRFMTKWTPTTILHRMQQIIRVFLKYHGFAPDDTLLVAPTVTDWNVGGPKDFGVNVCIRSPELLMSERDGVVPDRIQVQQTERALGWTLWALFVYAEEVGLKRLPFW